jgi:hypothetical protein
MDSNAGKYLNTVNNLDSSKRNMAGTRWQWSKYMDASALHHLSKAIALVSSVATPPLLSKSSLEDSLAAMGGRSSSMNDKLSVSQSCGNQISSTLFFMPSVFFIVLNFYLSIQVSLQPDGNSL